MASTQGHEGDESPLKPSPLTSSLFASNQNTRGYADIPIAEPLGYQDYLESQEVQENGIPVAKLLENLDDEIRMGFVRKVFKILALQLGFTFAVIFVCNSNDSTKAYLHDKESSSWLLWFGLAMSFMASIVIMCCNHLTRIHPHNLGLLATYTISQTIILSFVTVQFDLQAVLYACGSTAAIVVSLIMYATQTRQDFTGYGVYLYVAIWALLITGIISLFTTSETVQLMYSLFGAMLFSCFIVYDTQLIICGSHKRKFSVDDYVMAALMLYIDIIELFLFLLRIIAKARGNGSQS